MKRLLSGVLAAVLLLIPVSAAQPVETQCVRNKISFNGDEVRMDSYAIDNYTYFKIRDLSSALRFNVRWENAGIGVETKEYTAERDAERILELVNEARAAAGMAPLVMTEALCECAFIRAYEQPQMRGHTRPNGKSCFSVLDGLDFKRAGENVAGGQETLEEVMDGWLASEGHRANILDPKFTKIGIGRYHDYWAQLFVG